MEEMERIGKAFEKAADDHKKEIHVRHNYCAVCDFIGRVAKQRLVCIRCDCSQGDPCPQGKSGAEDRCTMWITAGRLT